MKSVSEYKIVEILFFWKKSKNNEWLYRHTNYAGRYVTEVAAPTTFDIESRIQVPVVSVNFASHLNTILSPAAIPQNPVVAINFTVCLD